MTTHEVLVAARNEIDRRGHCRGYGEGGEGFCVHQAIGWADSSPISEEASVLMKDLGATVEWNDAPERTKAEVLALFDRAIAATAPAPADPFKEGLGPVIEAAASLNLQVRS